MMRTLVRVIVGDQKQAIGKSVPMVLAMRRLRVVYQDEHRAAE